MISIPGYTTLRRLPPGGMSEIYVARGADHQRVVVRCLGEEFARNRKWRKRFESGAVILDQLEHPNIVRLLDRAQIDRRPYMLLEFADGETLRNRILARDSLITSHLLHLLRQMADVLYYIHTTGYLHLDFKPDNILISDDAHVTLLDFDLATRRRAFRVRARDVDGTPAYLPREALLEGRYSEQTDIYAFGVTTYEMINFHKPFLGDTRAEARIAQAHATALPEPLRLRDANLPAALESVILKCLAKPTRDRYPSMSLVCKALNNLV